MRLTPRALEDHLADVAHLLERYGVALDLGSNDDLVLDESPSGARSFELRGLLPDGRQRPRSVVELREVWRPTDAGHLERREYAYELVDRERDVRRAFHLHDPEWFVRRYAVVVHEHCERPIGTAPCPHVAGFPVKDAFRGVELLLRAWTDPDVPACDDLPCLDANGSS